MRDFIEGLAALLLIIVLLALGLAGAATGIRFGWLMAERIWS